MTTTTSAPTEVACESPAILAIIEQLRPPGLWKPRREWIAYGMAVLDALIAFLMGLKLFLVFRGLLAVVRIRHHLVGQLNRQQIELLIRIAEGLEKNGRSDAV